jgi:osmoprotectant transport system permease protein
MDFLGNVVDWFQDGSNWSGDDGVIHRVAEHVQISLVALLIAAAIALPIGIVLGHMRRGGLVAINVSNVGRALPTLAVLIILVQILGIGDPPGVLAFTGSLPTLIALVALAIPPMLTNAYVGITDVDADVRESAEGMGMSGRQQLSRVELPIALPLIMAGVRTSAVAVVATATLAAYVDAGGLGRYIVDGFAVQDNVKVFVGGLLVALLAVTVALAPAWMPPPLPLEPGPPATLPAIVLLASESVPPASIPPPPKARLPAIVDWVTARVPLDAIPPPLRLVPASLPATVARRRVRVPAFWIPPPLPSTKPPVTVRSESSAVTSGATSRTRSSPAASTTVVRAPAPMIRTLFVRSRSPVAAAFSPGPARPSRKSPAGRSIVSPPGPAFAARTASRSEQSESQAPGAGSSTRVTTNVAACAFAAQAKAAARTRATPIRALIGLRRT